MASASGRTASPDALKRRGRDETRQKHESRPPALRYVLPYQVPQAPLAAVAFQGRVSLRTSALREHPEHAQPPPGTALMEH